MGIPTAIAREDVSATVIGAPTGRNGLTKSTLRDAAVGVPSVIPSQIDVPPVDR